MKTRRFCPHCGRPLLKSQIKGYAFQCFCCDADFYNFEVYRKRHLKRVKNIRKGMYDWEIEAGCHHHSVHKPYPRRKY
ncbi:MAG: hypothetical protein LBI60_04735 [Bacteroidales bacterium]|jgi:hypothetical protein|nr:hypothetical protein [Bacteroidales bacterium]